MNERAILYFAALLLFAVAAMQAWSARTVNGRISRRIKRGQWAHFVGLSALSWWMFTHDPGHGDIFGSSILLGSQVIQLIGVHQMLDEWRKTMQGTRRDRG